MESQSQYVRLIRVFVSSPGDVAEERKTIEEIINQANKMIGQANQVRLEIWEWNENLIPQIGPDPQAVVDAQMPPYDIYIGIMSNKFGTPTEGYGSGTEHEFRNALKEWFEHGSPWIMFYFNKKPAPSESSAEVEQLSKVVKFREELETMGIVKRYDGVRGKKGALYEMVFEHLCELAQKLKPLQPPERSQTEGADRGGAHIRSDQKADARDLGIDQLAIAQNIKKIHVNREKELNDFRDILAGRSDKHIMVIEAESGLGKTALIKQFWAMSNGINRAKVDFIITNKRVGDTLADLCHQFGKNVFPVLHHQCANLMATAQMPAGSPALLLSSIDAALAKVSPDERSIQRKLITDAFFEDLSNIHHQDQKPIVMLFDTFQKAHDSIQEWLPQVFLPRIIRYPWIACVVCGQPTPNLAINLDCCQQIKLEGLKENHVREYLHRAKLERHEQYINLITKHSEGRPIDLQQFALTLSLME